MNRGFFTPLLSYQRGILIVVEPLGFGTKTSARYTYNNGHYGFNTSGRCNVTLWPLVDQRPITESGMQIMSTALNSKDFFVVATAHNTFVQIYQSTTKTNILSAEASTVLINYFRFLKFLETHISTSGYNMYNKGIFLRTARKNYFCLLV